MKYKSMNLDQFKGPIAISSRESYYESLGTFNGKKIHMAVTHVSDRVDRVMIGYYIPEGFYVFKDYCQERPASLEKGLRYAYRFREHLRRKEKENMK